MKLTGMLEDEPNCKKKGFLNKNFSGVYITKINQKEGRNTVFEAFLIFLGLQLKTISVILKKTYSN